MVLHVNFNDVLFIGGRDCKILFDHHFKIIGLKFIFPNKITSKVKSIVIDLGMHLLMEIKLKGML